MDVEEILDLARAEIKSHGWTVTVRHSDQLPDNQIHIELVRNGERRAWGYLPDLHCWSEVYKAITGKDILSLKPAP